MSREEKDLNWEKRGVLENTNTTRVDLLGLFERQSSKNCVPRV